MKGRLCWTPTTCHPPPTLRNGTSERTKRATTSNSFSTSMRTVTVDPAELGANLKGGVSWEASKRPKSSTSWSMVVSWFPKIGGIGDIYIITQLAVYIPLIDLIVLANWVIICYQSHLLREPGNSIELVALYIWNICSPNWESFAQVGD